VIGQIVHFMFMALPAAERMRISKARFQKFRETFYRETRLDIEAQKGLRNRETLLERLKKFEDRYRSRRQLIWPVFHAISARMAKGDSFAAAMRPYIPNDEFTLLSVATTSAEKDAVRRGLELAEMAASAKRVLSNTTSAQLAYPVFLLVFMYGFCMLFGGYIFPEVLEIRPLDQWTTLGQWLYRFDTLCYDNWWLTGLGVSMLVVAYFYTLKRWTGPLRNRIDDAPLMWRNRRDLRAALLIVSFAGLFDSNLTLRASIDRLTETADPWMRWHLSRMGRRLTRTPHQPMRALDTGIFSIEIVDTITDAAGRDRFVQAIKHLGRASLDTVVEKVRTSAKIAHRVLLVLALLSFAVFGVGSYITTGAASFLNLQAVVSAAPNNKIN
jgi:hypothetical protein